MNLLKINVNEFIQRPPSKVILGMIGKRYGRLIVLRYAGTHFAPLSGGKTYVWCKCDCGEEVIKPAAGIRIGHTKSCGCLLSESSRSKMLKHGDSTKSKIYSAWQGMRARCFGKKEAYERYKKNGITICSGWADLKHGYLSFKADMGEPPSPKHSLDRIDFTGHYSCGHCEECMTKMWTANCRWADGFTQANNTSKNRYVIVDGEKLSFRQAERKLGFHYGLISSRIKRGWTYEQAISVPPKYGNKIKHRSGRPKKICL